MKPAPLAFRQLIDTLTSRDEQLTPVEHTTLDSIGPDGEACRVIQYLTGMGLTVTSLDQLLDAIRSLADEEELSAFAVKEGVAVSHASDGWWVIFHR